jgi:agmatine/peptidylarginine deiminase
MTLRGTWMDCAAFMVGNFCAMITRKWTSRIGKRFLTKWGYEPIEIPSAVIEGQDDSAQGIYLNYVIAGGAAFVPVSDEVDALEQRRALVAMSFSKILAPGLRTAMVHLPLQKALELELVEIPADECAREGGALHCVMWVNPRGTLNPKTSV